MPTITREPLPLPAWVGPLGMLMRAIDSERWRYLEAYERLLRGETDAAAFFEAEKRWGLCITLAATEVGKIAEAAAKKGGG